MNPICAVNWQGGTLEVAFFMKKHLFIVLNVL